MRDSKDGVDGRGDCSRVLGGLSEEFYLFEMGLLEADLADLCLAIHTS